MVPFLRSGLGLCAATLLTTTYAAAAPPTPSGPHPRLFMSAANVAAYKKNATASGTAAAGLVAQCDDTVANASNYAMRGGSDGNNWPQSAAACAFAYVATGKASYLTQALLYWNASLNDDQMIGDGLGCKPGVSTDWQTWANGSMSGDAPPIILTVTHDTGYAMRWYAPDIAIVYDWLSGATGVPTALLQQTQLCLTSWIDFYTAAGYHAGEAGANYNAGYVVGKVLGAIAIGNDNGADGHLWSQAIDADLTTLLIGSGLAGSSGALGTKAGPMVGGGWAEGWQYGPLSVLEYAAAASAAEANGASLPALDQWASSLILREIYATTPPGNAEFCGEADCDMETPNQPIDDDQLDAVLLGPSSDMAASWALSVKQTQKIAPDVYVYDAIAEARAVTAQDYTKQSPAPPLWYLARGTREVFARTSWDPGAFWGVFTSAPHLNSDHQHYAATGFVFSRGADDLLVDPSQYGGYATWEANAVTADSSVVTGDDAPSQTGNSAADLTWARGTADATFAARGDFAHAFDEDTAMSDISYAHRDWVMLPEGEVVLVDRVLTSAASRKMYVTFHTNTGGGGLQASGGIYLGKVGSSQVAIHPVQLSGATPVVSTPGTGMCALNCNFPCGACDVARFAVDEYRASVPGTAALAIHVIDGLGAGEQPATVASINDATVDPSAQNSGVLGASVYRATKQSYVVASSASGWAVPTTMTYGVPGTSSGRHIVFDAPEASDGTSSVSASASSGRCVLTITAGTGGGFTGHPLMFQVSSASDGCKPTDSTDVSSSPPPPGGGIDGGSGSGSGRGGGSGGGSSSGASNPASAATLGGNGGCGCAFVGANGGGIRERAVALLIGALAVAHLARRRRRSG